MLKASPISALKPSGPKPPRRVTTKKLTLELQMVQARQRSKRALGKEGDDADATKRESCGRVQQRRGQRGRLLDPSCELEVLKCIMLREGYLASVTRLSEAMTQKSKRSRGQSQALPPGMVDLLDLLRMATLDTVEAISYWRLSQLEPRTTPFEWNGHNYLVKMLQDCNFLDSIQPLRCWLGFKISRNPFFLPSSTLSCPNNTLAGYGACTPSAECRSQSLGSIAVGRQPWLGPLEVPNPDNCYDETGKGHRRNRKKRKVDASGNLAPYAAAVINDLTILPFPTACSSMNRKYLSPTTIPASNKTGIRCPTATTKVDLEKLVPNLVSREDARRVEVARQVLVEEEIRVSAATKISSAERGKNNRLSTTPSATPTHHNNSPRGSSLLICAGFKQASQFTTGDEHEESTSRIVPGIKTLVTDQDKSGLPETVNTQMFSLALTTAALTACPLPVPHQGLGPVLLRSDIPGGDFHSQPFLHTVAGVCRGVSGNLEKDITIAALDKMSQLHKARCSTAPFPSRSGGLEGIRGHLNSRRSSANRRPTTAPASKTGTIFTSRTAPLERLRMSSIASNFNALSSLEHYRRAFCRKAGAELRTLTAAGTTGRRQPPLREVRLQRLARDVARNTAELWKLANEEQYLRHSLASLRRNARLQTKQTHDRVGFISLDGGLNEEFSYLDRVGSIELGPKEREGDIISDVNTKGNERHSKLGRPSKEEMALKNRHLRDKRTHEPSIVSVVSPRSAVGRVKALLEFKRREMKLKTFDLKIKRDELCTLQVVQKQERGKKQALEVERRRLHLREGQSLREDEEVAQNLEEASALVVQKRFRGNRGRAYASWYKDNINQLQRVYRGMRGRRRAAARRTMLAAANKALDWVSLEALHPNQVKELAYAIHCALVDPVCQFPPAGVLGALRVVLIILDDTDAKNGEESASNKKSMVTFQTTLGRTVQTAVSASELTWEMATRVLRRPFRLLRRMRAFASGLGASSDSTPARLLRLSPMAMKLLRAYRSDASWSEEALLTIEKGGKAACALVGWAKELEVVYTEQPRVLDFLRDAQPAWLRKARSFQKHRRAIELLIESCRSAVAVGREYCQYLETQGLAYGDPLLALDILGRRCIAAKEVSRELESKKWEFLLGQKKSESAAGRALKEDVEFAEREMSVAERAEGMARRIGKCGDNELGEVSRKRTNCEVILRELTRRFQVWERRCQEENNPLLEEWVPPTGGQVNIARALGSAQAWEEITAVQKARIMKEAGGFRYVKGLPSNDIETWKGVSEALIVCREDVESRKAKLAADVSSSEQRILSVNESSAAEKVCSATWDNATDITKSLERQEDEEAARDEHVTAMGITLPPGLLEKASRPLRVSSNPPSNSSQRPILVLFGLDLPALVRSGARARLDHSAPSVFGLHLVGADSLPSLATTTRTGDRGFLEPCRDQERTSLLGPKDRAVKAGSGEDKKAGSFTPPGSGACDMSSKEDGFGPSGGHSIREGTRALRVQAALSAGKSVSLDVAPGPGLWARGRFLRDLESLLGGLDGGGSYDKNITTRRRDGPVVLLIEGHDRNRSGGGANAGFGTHCVLTTEPLQAGDSKKEMLARQRQKGVSISPAMATRRAKHLLEEAAQCLHDLSVTHGDTPNPFIALSTVYTTPTSTKLSVIDKSSESGHIVRLVKASEPSEIVKSLGNEATFLSATNMVPGLELVLALAACHMILHPYQRYHLGESRECNTWMGSLRENIRKKTTDCHPTSSNVECVISSLAEICRQELAEMPSARGVAGLLRKADITMIPFDTAVSIRNLVRHEAWLGVSLRPIFTGCSASQAFIGWVVAAVTAATELAIEGGGAVRDSPVEKISESLDEILMTETGRSCFHEGENAHGGTVEKNARTEGDKSTSRQILLAVQEERWQERELLNRLEASLVDEKISVFDDDSPWCLNTVAVEKDEVQGAPGRHCRASEMFEALMDIILRPYKVFEQAEHPTILADSSQPSDTVAALLPQQLEPSLSGSPLGANFRVSVSRAFGSIYVRAVPQDGTEETRGHALVARAKDEDLITLLSPNWMETHDLSALREFTSEKDVWRALVDTLIVRYPDKMAGQSKVCRPRIVDDHQAIDVSLTKKSVPRGEQVKAIAASPSQCNSKVRSAPSSLFCDRRVVVLSFRHSRRMTLETGCLLMGCVVAVRVFEESRSDFWCEAYVPIGVTPKKKILPVGIRIPKESVSLLLDHNHPMRMQTVLDASDMRELSALIADRLKLRRIRPARGGPRSYRYWLDSAIGENNWTKTGDSIHVPSAPEGIVNGKGQTGQNFLLSLRKRGVGQVVFSRLVSFWVPRIGNGDSRGVTTSAHNFTDQGGKHSSRKVAHIIQRIITLKEIAHRGECGELWGEVYNPEVGGTPELFVPTPQLTGMILEGRRKKSTSINLHRQVSTNHWRDSLTWRFRLVLRNFSPSMDSDGWSGGGGLPRISGTTNFSSDNQDQTKICMVMDDRRPMFCLRAVSVERESSATGNRGHPSLMASNTIFDLLLLSNQEMKESRDQLSHPLVIELIATHRQTMAVFSFPIPVEAFIEEYSDIVTACLAAPTALSKELERSVSDAVSIVAGKWLKYYPGDNIDERGAIVTFSFPGTLPITAAPFVGLRGAGCTKKVGDNLYHRLTRARIISGFGVENKAGTARVWRRPSVQVLGEKSETVGGQSAETESRRRSTSVSIATQPIETRNERMVFRRKLAIPRVEEIGDQRKVKISERDSKHSTKRKTIEQLAPEILAISVYEAFSAGHDGRVARYLKICARDETARPTTETVISVPWAGTCEGIEGGVLWQVITQYMRFQRKHDKKGRYVGLELEVSLPESFKTDDVSRVPGREQQGSNILGPSFDHRRGMVPEGSGQTRKYDDNPNSEMIGEEILREQARNRQQFFPALGFKDNAEVVNAPLGSTRGYGGISRSNEFDSPGRQCIDETARNLPPVQTLPSPFACQDTTAADLNKGAAQLDTFDFSRGRKIYDGWHRITGMRLYVQCFLEVGCTIEELSSTFDDNNMNDEVSRRGPTGRGGTPSSPHNSFLRFLVRDPKTGRRNKAEISVDDVRNNLSTSGGAVEAGLLRPGRRFALAKVFAQKLRLEFDAHGGYRVAIPLPTGWNIV